MIETIEKLLAIPVPVWIGLTIFLVGFAVYVRATNPGKAHGDFKVSKPAQPLQNGSPYRASRQAGSSHASVEDENSEHHLTSGNHKHF